MVIYFTDRHGEVLASAATNLPNDKTIINEKMTDELNTGVKIFECSIFSNKVLRECAITGNYVLAYGTLFSIVRSSFDTSSNIITLYCEDAGMDFLNRVCGQVKKSSKTLKQWVDLTLGSSSSSGWNYIYNISNTSKEMEYTAEATALERLRDILANYNADFYFTYDIDGFKWVSRSIHFVKKRGNIEKEHRLYLNKEIASIIEEQSVEELATVWKMYGKDNKKLEDLTGYSTATKTFDRNGHHYTVVGSEVRCTDAITNWKSKLDKDGRILKVKYTNYSKAASAISYAVKNMVVEPVYTYQVTFNEFPDDIECGDYVYVLDSNDDILLHARVLNWVKSETGQNACTLGEFERLESSIADIDFSKIKFYSLQIESRNGLIGKGNLSTILNVTVFRNGQAITSIDDLIEGQLNWYEDGIAIPATDSRISNSGFTFTINNLTTGHTYACKLEEIE